MELDLPGRLLIERVVLKNFKSYAGEKTIGPFHKNLTSVVGPNGSGKSNLLESLLFAFGKRARKMRLKKLSELIHRSSAHPNLSEACVEVHFVNIIDHGSSYEEVPGSKLILSRIVKKNSTSEYRLDGRSSSFEEVTRTLKNRGIDLEHNRFLILQGEVEQIAMMKPKSTPGEESKSGLLEYLEEIIGTDKYVADIEKAEKELETIGDEVASKKLRFEESKKIMENLDSPMKEAVAFIELDKECYSFKCLKSQIELFKTALKGKEVRGDIKIQDDKIKELQVKFEQKVKDNEDSIKEYERKVKEIQKIEENREKITEEINKIIQSDTLAHAEVIKCKNSIKDHEEEIKKNTSRCKEIEKELKDLNNKLPSLQSDLETAKEEKETKEKTFRELEKTVSQVTSALSKKKSSAEEELKPLKRGLTQSRAEKESKNQDLNDLTRSVEGAETEKINISEKLENFKVKKLELEKELETLQKTLQDSEKEIKTFQDHQELTEKEISSLKMKSSEVLAKILQIEQENKNIYQSRGQLSEILKAKLSKELSGIHGRLGDLASISPAYDVACSTAIGMLDYIVVDTVSDSNKLMDFCRRKNLGKVSILCIEKINVDEEKMRNFNPGNIKGVRLFDQLSITDEKLRKVFYFAFKDLICTENIENAREIAFGPHPFNTVTKGGDMVSPSGEMRGVAVPSHGRIKTTSGHANAGIQGNLDELKHEKNQIAKQLEDLQIEKSKVEKELANCRNLEKERKKIALKAQNELKVIQNDSIAAENRLNFLNSRSIERTLQEIENCKKIIFQLDENLEKLTKLIQQKNLEIEEIVKEIELAAGEDFRRVKAEFLAAEQFEEKIDKELSVCISKVQQRNKDLEKYSNSKKKSEELLEETKKILENAKAKREENKENSRKLASVYQEFTKKLEENKEVMKEIEKQKIKISKEFDQLKSEKIEIKEKKNQLEALLKHIENEVERWDIQVQHIQNDFEKIESEYAELLNDMENETSQVQTSENGSRKNKFNDERINLRRPVFWVPTENELFELLPSLPVIKNIQETLEQELESLTPNLKVIEDYKLKKSDKQEKETQLNQVKQRETTLRNDYIEIKSRRFNEFTRGFREISDKLQEMYTLLTRGGNAELEFADSTDPFSEGIIFTVRPPSKSWKKMANLSGGEKTLSSLALVFALHHYKPNALYVMDEVDAALDFQNVSVIANYIKGETKNAQFIVVSLRYQMFEVADQLVGIYKVKDVSQSLCISPYSLSQEDTSNVIIKQTLDNISLKNN
jgi:structural maintenance of chromosome 4